MPDRNTATGKKTSRYQKPWFMLIIFSVAYIAVFANIQGFVALLPLVQEEFLISRAQVGLYTSFYFLSAVLIAVFSGRITDYLGTKKGLILSVGVIGLMMGLHSVAPLYGILLVLAFFTGIAFSIVTPSVNRGVVELSDPSKRSFYMGIVHGGGGIGGILGAVTLPYFGEMIGWRTALLMSSVFAVAVALFIFRYYHPLDSSEIEEKSSPEGELKTFKEDLSYLLGNRYLLSIFSMGIVFGISISSITGHYPLFLTQDLNFSAAFAGLGLGTFHVGGILGQPFWGLINEKVFQGDRRKGLALLGILIFVLTMFFALIVSRFALPSYTILILSFLLGFCILGTIAIYFTAVSELVTAKHVGMVTGLALVFPRTSTVIAPPLFGLVADIRGNYYGSWFILGAIVLVLTISFIYFSGKYIRPSGSSEKQEP